MGQRRSQRVKANKQAAESYVDSNTTSRCLRPAQEGRTSIGKEIKKTEPTRPAKRSSKRTPKRPAKRIISPTTSAIKTSPLPAQRRLTYNLRSVGNTYELEQCSMDYTAIAECERTAAAAAAADPVRESNDSNSGATKGEADIEAKHKEVQQMLMHLDTSLDGAGVTVEKSPSPLSRPQDLHLTPCDARKSDKDTEMNLPVDPIDGTGDGDATMSTAPEPLKEASPNTATEMHASSPDSSDDEGDLSEFMARVNRRSARLAAAADTSKNTPVTLAPIRGSVFGMRVNGSSSRTSQTDKLLEDIVRDRTVREARQLKIAELRKDVHAGPDSSRDMDDDEKFIATMAESESRNEEERLRQHDKYYCSLALFLSPPAPPKPNAVHWKRTKKPKHPLHDLLLSARDVGDNLGVGFRTTVEFCCNCNTPPPKYVAEMLFHRVVYDDTDDEPGTLDREEEFQSLIYIIMRATKEVPLPSMNQVLCAYGAILPESNAGVNAIDAAPDESLDKQMFSSTTLERSSNLAIRNLDRAFAIWTAQIESEMEYSLILGEKRPKMRQFSTATTYRLGMVGVCVQVLLSPFGSRLRHSVGSALEVVLDGVDAEDWTKFRQRCVRDILSLTSRLGLLVELVTYLLPIRQPRSRAFGLDLAYLAMWRWHRGPTETPLPVDIPEEWPSALMNSEHPVSYTLSDVLECMRRVPELGKTTDVHWCCALMRILKMCLVDNMVLDSREEGEIARVNALIKKFSMCAHRMLFGVPRQNLRLALDATVAGLRVFLGPDAARELNPPSAMRDTGLSQGTISFNK